MFDLQEEIKKRIIANYPTAIVYLYGSHARGNAHQDSDWDVLILVDTEKINYDTEQLITSPLYDLEFETGEIISPMLYTVQEWNNKYKPTPYYQNVMREGIRL